jgi:hypothetical protein
MVVKPAAAAPVIQVRTLTRTHFLFKSPHPRRDFAYMIAHHRNFATITTALHFSTTLGVSPLSFVHDHCNPSTFHHP